MPAQQDQPVTLDVPAGALVANVPVDTLGWDVTLEALLELVEGQ